jgi:hypothetical protein
MKLCTTQDEDAIAAKTDRYVLLLSFNLLTLLKDKIKQMCQSTPILPVAPKEARGSQVSRPAWGK